jgi:hypothetical protein
MKRVKPLILSRRILGVIGIGILSGLILADFVFAQATGVTISPLTFELTANPGDTLTNTLKVYNPTSSIISIKMEAEDIKAVGETGQVIVEPEVEATYSLKRWIKTEPAEFTLEPGEQKFVNFEISVPENAEPGGKYGSVLASTTGVVGKGATGTAIAQKVGALLLLTVAGEVKEELKIVEFTAPPFLEYGPVPFTMRFENTGTVHVRPRGFVTITNWWGKKVADVEFSQLNVIPGAIRKIETKWDNKWLFGKYTAMLVGSYGTANLPFNPPVLEFWVFPWKIALGIFIILLLIFAFFYKTRRRWRLALRVLLKGEPR